MKQKIVPEIINNLVSFHHSDAGTIEINESAQRSGDVFEFVTLLELFLIIDIFIILL